VLSLPSRPSSRIQLPFSYLMVDCIFEINWSSIRISQFGDLPITSSCSSFLQILKSRRLRKEKFGENLHNIWVLKVVWWEDLELQFERNVGTSLRSWVLRIFVLVLIVYQVGDNVGFTDIYQEGVPDDYRSLKLSESPVSLPEVLDFVLSVEGVALDKELTALVVVAATHHWVD